MKDYIKEIIDKNLDRNENENRIREYIQKYFLYILYKKKLYKNLVFVGGTALRFIYNTRRFSEDLDFSLSENSDGYDFFKMLEVVKNELTLAGYSPEVKYNKEGSVNNAFFKFPDLLYEVGLNDHKKEKISIKVEIDKNSPQGGKEKVSLYNSTFLFYLLHYDLSSMFAGKLHALLCRKYDKGRDWYDLMWYLSKFENLEPNLILLNNAVQQTCSRKLENNIIEDWKVELNKKLDTVDMKKIRDDVERFLEDKNELRLLTKETFKNLLR